MSLFIKQQFIANSGHFLEWKIECDALTDEDIETLAYVGAGLCNFGSVIGVPRGGLRLAEALKRYASSGPPLIVDDVLTTGGSMERERKNNPDAIGLVVFARGTTPTWVRAIFSSGV